MCADVRRSARMCALTGTRTALVPVCARPRLTRLPLVEPVPYCFGGTLTAPRWVVSDCAYRPQGRAEQPVSRGGLLSARQFRLRAPRRNRAAGILVIAAVFGLMLVAPATSAAYADFRGASSDGSKVFFHTAEQLVSGDTDAYQTSTSAPGARRPWSPRARSTATAPSTPTSTEPPATARGSSSHTDEQLVSGDTDSAHDLYERSGGTTTLVSQGQINGNGAFDALFSGASSDGSKVFFRPTSGWSAATPTAPRTSTSAPGGRRPWSPRARSTATAPSMSVFGTAPRATARRSSSTPTSSWSAATPTAPMTSTSAPGGRRPWSPRARSTATAPSMPSSGAPRATARRSSSRPPSSW